MRSSFSTIFLLYHVLSIWNFLILTCTIYILAPYLADPKSGPCPFFKKGDTFVLKRTNEQDDFYHLMNGKFCGEAWDAISRYVYTALQGGSIMRNWTNDDRMMIACCNDGTRSKELTFRKRKKKRNGLKNRISKMMPAMPTQADWKRRPAYGRSCDSKSNSVY